MWTKDIQKAHAVAHAVRATERACDDGFRCLKIKIGGASLDGDIARVRAVHAAAPEAELILDANAALSAREAVDVLRGLGSARERVALFEQPTARDDIDGLAEVDRWIDSVRRFWGRSLDALEAALEADKGDRK